MSAAGDNPRVGRLLLALACLSVLAGYLWIVRPSIPEHGLLRPEQQHFNLLVRGLRSGHLYLGLDPPPELARLPDPYDPKQNLPYRLHDASYYHGRYYIYYGITPAIVLFWPFVALTGHYLAQKYAVALFCAGGFLIGAALVWRVGRRCFPGVGDGVLIVLVAGLGTANGAAFLVRRPEMYEVSIACAYAMVMAALAAVWHSLGGTRRPLAWTALASLLFGLAVGSRPTFLFATAAQAVPALRLLRAPSRPALWRIAAAALGPLALVGLGLAVYNYERFGDPREFGVRYLLMNDRITRYFAFDPSWIWFNLRAYFLLPGRWMEYFPFVHGIEVPPLPEGYAYVENPYGVLANMPFLLLAAAVPLAWRAPGILDAGRVRSLAAAAAWVFAAAAAPLLVFVVACVRYEFDFTPYLALLAVLGVLGIEQEFSARRGPRGLARAGWGMLLAVSAAFAFFASCDYLHELERSSAGEFRALSGALNYPRYAFNQAAGSRRGPAASGPLILRVVLPAAPPGGREPLLTMGRDPQVIAFMRVIARDRVTVGFEFSGNRVYECRPVALAHAGTAEVTVYGPCLLPDLGEREWGDLPYARQLFDLGMFAIAVDGKGVIEVNSLVDEPIEREVPLAIGFDRLGAALPGGRFTGQVTPVGRAPIQGSLLTD